ncbi:IS66 family transposase [Massilia sp. CCM 9210]|nr:IS66 family transposase [Massilia sp. CCM 9210]MDQ1818165.1 IS66 family transposase [Massilia sp. CCM 9210]
MLAVSDIPALTLPPIELPKPDVAAFGLPASLPRDAASLADLLHAQQKAFVSMVDTLHAQATQAARHALEQAVRRAAAQAVNEYVVRMVEQAKLARHRLYGASSEQMAAFQHGLFDEAETLAQGSGAAQDQAPPPATDAGGKPLARKARGKRTGLPNGLPRVDVVHDVPESERTCPCGSAMVLIGEDVSEQLDIVPMQVRVLRHVRKRYGCPGSTHAPVTAPLPPQPLPKSNASVNFLALLLVAKFLDGLPLARFEHVLARHGIVVPRQTLARWVIGAARVLQPLHNLLRDILLDGALIHMDETVVQVLKEPGKAPTSNSYMWVQTGGPPTRPVVLYDYDPGRGAQVPTRLLEGFRGYLMTDGYEAYNAVARSGQVEHLVCWAHARRRFVEAARVQPKGKRGKADEAIALIGKLYGIERTWRDGEDAQRWQARRQHSVPLLAELRAWLDATLPGVPGKTKLGEALSYLHKYWPKLVRYVERGDLPIDNNRCENAIRPFVVGRKGWLFADTPAGAHASAVIYSLMQTAKANGVEPYEWLRHVLRELPAAKTVEQVEALLPWHYRAGRQPNTVST